MLHIPLSIWKHRIAFYSVCLNSFYHCDLYPLIETGQIERIDLGHIRQLLHGQYSGSRIYFAKNDQKHWYINLKDTDISKGQLFTALIFLEDLSFWGVVGADATLPQLHLIQLSFLGSFYVFLLLRLLRAHKQTRESA